MLDFAERLIGLASVAVVIRLVGIKNDDLVIVPDGFIKVLNGTLRLAKAYVGLAPGKISTRYILRSLRVAHRSIEKLQRLLRLAG